MVYLIFANLARQKAEAQLPGQWGVTFQGLAFSAFPESYSDHRYLKKSFIAKFWIFQSCQEAPLILCVSLEIHSIMNKICVSN